MYRKNDNQSGGNFNRERTNRSSDRTNSYSGKSKYSYDKPKWSSDKAISPYNKKKISLDRTNSHSDRSNSSFGRSKWSSDKPKYSSDRSKSPFERSKFSSDRATSPYNRKRIDLDRPKRVFEASRRNPKTITKEPEMVRLNRYIANSGLCSRREADELIAEGLVKVNEQIITQMGYKVSRKDVVTCRGKRLIGEKKVYVLLNKPKDFITTTEDERGRKTVMDLVRDACRERIYPVGRLDRNTTGVLLLTNDGELAKMLTHPSYGAKKIYRVELNKRLTKDDMQRLVEGIELEDGKAWFDEIEFDGEDSSRKVIGVEIHSGRNRIVRRLFEALDYEVLKLDRTSFAGLTKKEIPRGHWRHLSEKEVGFLKMIRQPKDSK